MGSLRPSFGSRIQQREEETCICAPVVIGKDYLMNNLQFLLFFDREIAQALAVLQVAVIVLLGSTFVLIELYGAIT